MRRDYAGFGLHTIVDIALVILGLAIGFKWLELPTIGIIYAFVMALVGIILVIIPFSIVRRVGYLSFFLGTYLVLRGTGLISTQYLLYGLAGFLFFTGIAGVVRDAVATRDRDAVVDEEEGYNNNKE